MKSKNKKQWMIYGIIGFVIGLLPLLSIFICGINDICFALLSLPGYLFNYIGLSWLNKGHPPISPFITPVFYLIIAELIYLIISHIKK